MKRSTRRATWHTQEQCAGWANQGERPITPTFTPAKWANFDVPTFDVANHEAERANGFRR